MLRRSFEHFKTYATPEQRVGFAGFQQRNTSWLTDYGLFMALKGNFGGGSWHDWPRDIRVREPGAVEPTIAARSASGRPITSMCSGSFADQWSALKQHANELGIQIIGDIPIFVAEDSADVWARPDQFELDGEGNPIVIAGVPPDNFAETGQRWATRTTAGT